MEKEEAKGQEETPDKTLLTGHIVPVNIERHMQTAFLDYSMSVIVSRALPDVRDGMKPVQRRIIYTMNEMGITAGTPFKKSARIVGEVMGKYHPHGDSSVYGAMVHLAQPWSMRYMLVDGQGNFGSEDGDPPAAQRYTEARLKRISDELVADIEKDTVNMQNNYDDSLQEPTVLPCRFPVLLVNGTSGIAVGMATNMAPHNLSEACDGVVAYLDKRDITVDELMQYIKAPDFPGGGMIYGYDGIREAYRTGNGRVIMRGEATIETDEKTDKSQIIFTSIPYMLNKAEMIKSIAASVNDGKISGISDIRDESSREGIRIVFDLKRDAVANVVLNKLYKLTPLQSNFSINNIALVHGRPRLLNLKDIIVNFVEHRHEVILRRTRFEMAEAERRAHILEGLLIAQDHIDEVIAIIRASKTIEEAKNGLIEKFKFSDIQAQAIVEMRLGQLTGLQREKLQQEFEEKSKFIEWCRKVLADENMQFEIIRKETLEIKEKYGDSRRSQIIMDSYDFKIEDMISDDTMVITISNKGYIKRTPLAQYRAQGRGGKGSKGSNLRLEDEIDHLFVATMHNYLLLFTEQGKCYWQRVFDIPEGDRASKGRQISNLINIAQDDNIRAYLNTGDLKNEEYVKNHYVILCTKKGIVKKTTLEAYSNVRVKGVNAITVRDGDRLLEARLTNGNSIVMIALRSGKAIRFPEAKTRPMGRTAAGVRGIRLAGDNDEVVGMICVNNEEANVLVVSENGFGKRTHVSEYRETNRGGKGVKTINITEKTGDLIAIEEVTDNDDLMIINKNGVIIRTPVSELRVQGRNTQGVKLIDLKGKDSIASVAKVEKEEVLEENGEDIENSADGNIEDIENSVDGNVEEVEH
ncbi:MAG: DNA gyrase subunit A [Bacteroidales bacterium]|jgi:DNA gyrase subunit A|nr:DNA gyrase subunit A [Bacteroidales bacterium]